MKIEVAKLLVEDLRTPGLQQAHSKLQRGEAYCCLGRLCRIAEKHGVKVRKNGDGSLYGENLAAQPDVLDWAGMKPDGAFQRDIWNGQWKTPMSFLGHPRHTMASANDAGANFQEIALEIERQFINGN